MERLTSEFGGVLGEDSDSSAISGKAGDMDATAKSDTTSPAEYRRLTIQRCIQSLIHACSCRDANCRSTSCNRMKRVVTHAKFCKKKQQAQQQTQQNCTICKQLVALCCYHARSCTEAKCLVPYCNNFKSKLQAQKLQQKHEQNQIYMRRLATMSRSMAMSSSSSNATSNPPSTNSFVSSPKQQPGEYSPSPQSSLSSVTPPPAALHAVQQVRVFIAL